MKAKKGNSNQHTTSAKSKDKEKWVHFDDYLNVNDGRRHPISEQGLSRLGEQLIEWSRSEDALVLEDFFRERGIHDTTYRQWKERNTLFRLRYETARGNLGSRREKGAINRTYSERLIMNTMPRFDPAWKELEEWRSSLRSKEQAAGKADVKVVMEKFPSTDLVKEKHEKEDSDHASEGER